MLSLSILSSFPAAPAYNASGELIFAGQDPSMGGVMAYYHDILYIVMFIQILGSFTDWAWLALLLVRDA